MSSKWSVRELVEFLRKDVEALVVRVNDLALALDALKVARRKVEEMMGCGDQGERVHPELLIRLLYLLVPILSLEVIFIIHDSQSM